MPTIEVSDETYGRIKDQLADDEQVELETLDDLIGNKYLIRCVTHYWTGKVVARVGTLLQLRDAAWIADTGRFMAAVKDGILSEIEPVGDAFVSLGAVVDMVPWKHKLPRDQK